MVHSSASFHSLPPELVSAVVHHVAEYDATFDSLKDRQTDVWALSLVNSTLHELAQPLLASIVHVHSARGLQHFEHRELSHKVTTLICSRSGDWARRADTNMVSVSTSRFPFQFLRELRVKTTQFDDFEALHGHEHLERLAFEDCKVLFAWANAIVPQLKELSLDTVDLEYPLANLNSPSSFHFLSSRGFPSLLALGTRDLRSPILGGPGGSGYDKFLRQLDCIVTNDPELLIPSTLKLSLPTPFLFELDTLDSTSLRSVFSEHLASSPSARSQLRIRIECESDPDHFEIQAFFDFVETILRDSPPQHLTKQVSGLKSLITQLDCFSTDDIQTHCPSPQPKTPLLYDHTLSRGTTLEHEKHILESPASNQRYIRVGLRDEWMESAQVDLDVALDFVFFLLDKCTKLEQLYLDRAISGYQYDDTPTEEVKVRVERVEVVAEEKGVEIIWENEKDDLVRSLVSEEFWKRARQLKGDE
ncbi:hypothetical protein JCM16303_001776 [Sporobolomyces ruberrimus]